MAHDPRNTPVTRAALLKQDLGWLLESTFLSHLTEAEQDEALGAMRWRKYRRGEVIIEENAPARGVDLLIDGQVVVSTRGPKGNFYPVSRLGPGHLVGERSLLLDTRTIAQVRAISPVRSLFLSSASFTTLLARSEQLHTHIEDLVALRERGGALLEQLLKNSFLRSLGRADLERFIQAGKVERYEAGERLVSVGDRNRDVYVVLAGEVGVFAHTPSGARERLATQGGGWLFGQAAALLDLPRTADVEALSAIETLRVRGQTFMEIIARNPPLQRRLYQQLAVLDLRTDAVQASLDKPMVVGVQGTRAGLGATTLAYALAAGLSQDGDAAAKHTVTLVDMEGPRSAGRLGFEVLEDRIGEIEVARLKVPESWNIAVLWPKGEQATEQLVATLQSERGGEEQVVVAGAGDLDEVRGALASADALVLLHDAGETSQGDAERRGQQRIDAIRIGHGAEQPLRSAGTVVRIPADAVTPDPFWRRGDLAVLTNRHAPLGRAARRLVRVLRGRAVGLALGGGGALGYAHIGLIRTLLSADVEIDYIAGSSFGALAGGLYAAKGLDGLDALIAQRRRLFRTIGQSIVDTGSIQRFVDDLTGGMSLSETEIPFFPVSIDVHSGQEVILSSGSVGAGVRASSSLPGVFPALPFGRTYLVDGGIGNNVPASVIWEANANFILASNIIPSSPAGARGRMSSKLLRRVQSGTFGRVDHLLRSLYLLMSQTGRDRASVADYVFDLDLEGYNIYDFLRGDEIEAAGRDQAEQQLPVILHAYENDSALKLR